MVVRPAGLIARLTLAAALAIGATSGGASALAGGMAQAPRAEPLAGLPRWTGGVDLYRADAFTTQRTWRWCTAAGVQIMRNLVRREGDHSRAKQQRYFSYMRAHDRYPIPLADGVDPAGWAAGLRWWVDPRYRVVAQGSFRAALRSAVRSLRETDLPVGITVARGAHAWVLTGFTATADPAATRRFKVTSVRVVGPLWGLQNRSFGYDMRPNRKLSRAQFERFFSPWHYARMRMTWEGRWVSVQPVDAVAPPPRAMPPSGVSGVSGVSGA